MLVEIRSNIFTEKVINFHEGLNVVLGDDKGSNSIGKSTLLMIIDFAFGGEAYITHNKDVVINLGHHEFCFTFEFNGEKYHFIRDTENPKIVYESSKNCEKGSGKKLDDYNKELKELYAINSKQISFRDTVSVYSRVWGKENNNVKKPLHNIPQESDAKAETRLIKLFNKYNSIEMHAEELKNLNEQKSVLNKAGKYKLVPKITKTKVSKNNKEIVSISKEIESLGKSISNSAGDINEIISEEMILIREKKKKLIEEKEYYISRLNRTNKSMIGTVNADFDSLLEFFPNINLERLQKIESFHQGISSILFDEIKKAKKELTTKIDQLNKEIDAVVEKQNQILNPNEETTIFLDRLIELTSKLKNLQIENNYYEKLELIKKDIVVETKALEKVQHKIIEELNENINMKLKEINTFIYSDTRLAPKLSLSGSKYEYSFSENTGTGKSYANLIIFDLAILNLTDLPFIIHDSFLLKNIEIEAVEQIIEFYKPISKQIFIALDMIDIYHEETQKILEEKKVIQLTNENLLTISDWRNK